MNKFFRSGTDKKLCGVCGGIAAALGIDSAIVRVLVVCSFLYTMGITVILYFIVALCLQEDDVMVIDPTVRKMYKSRSNRVLCGVCGGIAEYFDMDGFVVRLIFVLTTLLWGFGLFVYLAFALLLSKENSQHM